MSTLLARLRALRPPRQLAPVGRVLRGAWAPLTPAGRAVLALALVAWLVAWRLGWQEMMVVAAGGGLLLVVAALFMLGRTAITVRLRVEPPRVTVGDAVTGALEVTNRARTPLLPIVLELPVGTGGTAFDLPLLRSGGTTEELFVVPTETRGVIPVGPVTSVRGDPVGLYRREIAWSEITEVIVHPEITLLESFGAGLMRDLEGSTVNQVSMSDLSFHALREYFPGDDLRHVHWRASARHGSLLVRQYLDTRRSHITVVVDCRPEVYRSTEDYEIAISTAGSILVRADLDEYDTSFVSGSVATTGVQGRAVLDGCARAVPGTEDILTVGARASQFAPDTSFLVLVTGPYADFRALRLAADNFPPDVAKLAVQIDSVAEASLRTADELTVLTLGELGELAGLMRWAAA